MNRDLRKSPLRLEERLAVIIGVEVFGNTKLFIESKTGFHRNTLTRICADRYSIIKECEKPNKITNPDMPNAIIDYEFIEKAHDLLVGFGICITKNRYNLEKENSEYFNKIYENVSTEEMQKLEKHLINKYFFTERSNMLFSRNQEIFSIDLSDISIPTYEKIQSFLYEIPEITVVKNSPRFTRLDVTSTVGLSSDKKSEIINELKDILPNISIK